MVNLPGRTGRRRRVLNEEILSASASHAAVRSFTPNEDRDAPRYSDAAGVEHHPQVTDFIPRRYRSIALFVAAGVGTGTLLALLRYFQTPLAALLGLDDSSAFRTAVNGGISVWFQAIVLIVAGVVCWLVYSIRRHRIDDIRGRYRIWLAAAITCVVLSADSAVAFHQILTDGLSQLTGWTALRGGAAWWLVLGTLPAAWILARTLLDVRECRSATALLTSAAMCYVAATVSFLRLLPTNDPELAGTASSAALLLGHWLACVAAIANARFVILDAQGLIMVKPRRSKEVIKIDSSNSEDAEVADVISMPAVDRKTQRRQRVAQAHADVPPTAGDEWVDGSRPEPHSYDEEGNEEAAGAGRKLGKSDRKRLRQFKAQRRAA